MTGPAAARADSPAATLPRSRLPLFTAALLAVCWWLVLFWMAAFTANPVTLNREQIVRASYIVTGKMVGDPTSGKIAVEREWKGDALKGTILVNDLADVVKPLGSTYIIPLSRAGHGFHVTEMLTPNTAPRIYPATPEAIDQLQSILGTQQDHQ